MNIFVMGIDDSSNKCQLISDYLLYIILSTLLCLFSRVIGWIWVADLWASGGPKRRHTDWEGGGMNAD